MKFFLLGLATTTILLFTSCSEPKVKSPIVGKWKLVNSEIVHDGKYLDIEKSIDSVSKQALADTINAILDTTGGRIVTPADSAGIKGAITGAKMISGITKGAMGLYKIEFKSNGTIIKKLFFFSTEADYILSLDQKTVSYTLDGEKNEMEIISVSDKEMVLKNKFTYSVLTFQKLDD